MAEGGDTETTNPFKPYDPNEGGDDTTSLLPHHEEEVGMKDMTSTPTSTSRQRWQYTEETSFGGTPSGVMEMRTEAVDEIKKSIQRT